MAEYRLIESGHQDIYPDVAKVVDEVVAAAEQAGFDMNIVYGTTTFPDHSNRRCADFMVGHLSKHQEAGDWIVDYLLRNRSRLGVRFLVWDRRVIRSYDKPGIPAWSWARYTGANPHTDHPHLEIESGYDYRPPKQQPRRRGALYVTERGGVWARKKPHDRKPVARRPDGFTVRIVAQKTSGGTRWGRASGGLWYRMDALTRKLPGQLYVTTAALNCRTGPGTRYRIVRTWPKGTTLRIVDIDNGWAEGSGGRFQSAQYLRRK